MKRKNKKTQNIKRQKQIAKPKKPAKRKPAVAPTMQSAKLVVQQDTKQTKVVLSYDEALKRIYPQDQIRVIIPNKGSQPTLVPRDLVTETFNTHEVSEAGEHAKSINFGLAVHSDENGWMFIETMPLPAQPHSVIKECEGKTCVACPAPATHKIVEVVEGGEPKKAYLCCYHFCFCVFGKTEGEHCR